MRTNDQEYSDPSTQPLIGISDNKLVAPSDTSQTIEETYAKCNTVRLYTTLSAAAMYTYVTFVNHTLFMASVAIVAWGLCLAASVSLATIGKIRPTEDNWKNWLRAGIALCAMILLTHNFL